MPVFKFSLSLSRGEGVLSGEYLLESRRSADTGIIFKAASYAVKKTTCEIARRPDELRAVNGDNHQTTGYVTQDNELLSVTFQLT